MCAGSHNKKTPFVLEYRVRAVNLPSFFCAQSLFKMALSATLQGIVAQDLCTFMRCAFYEHDRWYRPYYPPLFGNTSVHVVLLNEDRETHGPDFRGTFLCDTNISSNGYGYNKLANDIYFSEHGKSLVHTTDGQGKTVHTLFEEHKALKGRTSVKWGETVAEFLPLVVLNADQIVWDAQSTLAQQLEPWQNAHANAYSYTFHSSSLSTNTVKPKMLLYLIATKTWPGLDLNTNTYSVQDYRDDPLIELAYSPKYNGDSQKYSIDLVENRRRGVEQMCRNALTAYGQRTPSVEAHALAKITETAKATLQATLLDVQRHVNAVSGLNTFVQNLTRGNADVMAFPVQTSTADVEAQTEVGNFKAEAETQTVMDTVDPLFGVAEPVTRRTEEEDGQRAAKRPRPGSLRRLWTLPSSLTKLI